MIHSTAIIDPSAQLAEGVEVGPYAIIGAEVKLGAGNVVGPHAVVTGRTTLGAGNRVFAHAVLGGLPKDLDISDRARMHDWLRGRS